MNKSNNRGFSLVELLVVISIIGILSSIAVVSLNTARTKARDALRKGDMAQIRTAMNLYYDDNQGYPVCGTWVDNTEPYGATADQPGADCFSGIAADPPVTLAKELTGGTRPYLASLPKDPRNPTNSAGVSIAYLYRYVSNGMDYALVYQLEEEPGIDQIIRGW